MQFIFTLTTYIHTKNSYCSEGFIGTLSCSQLFIVPEKRSVKISSPSWTQTNLSRYNKISFVKVIGAMEALNVQKSDAAEWYGNQ